jgi:hypothetical protein
MRVKFRMTMLDKKRVLNIMGNPWSHYRLLTTTSCPLILLPPSASIEALYNAVHRTSILQVLTKFKPTVLFRFQSRQPVLLTTGKCQNPAFNFKVAWAQFKRQYVDTREKLLFIHLTETLVYDSNTAQYINSQFRLPAFSVVKFPAIFRLLTIGHLYLTN